MRYFTPILLRRLALLSALAATLAPAEEIAGTVVVLKKLTRSRVTAPLSLYERGPAVELGKDPDSDPLAFERARVVVYVENAEADPAKPVQESIVQEGRRFTPDLVAIPAGSSVSFPNLDPIFHNVFSLSKPKNFDLGNYPKGATRVVTFGKPGIVYVNCHLHPDMAATVVVTPNRWYAKADAAGRFALHDLPPGTYSLVAWHKAAGFVRKSVAVAPGRNASIEIQVPIADEPPRAHPMTGSR